jgi:predicted nucleic acid-binding protein
VILYLDTSSLVKLYVTEDGSAEVRDLVEQADVVSTSVVAFPEARSALARLHREETLNAEEHASARDAFLSDWDSFLKIRVLQRVYEHAGELTETHGLRGFDALHPASFLEVVAQANGEQVEFSAFDGRLVAAATAESKSREGR